MFMSLPATFAVASSRASRTDPLRQERVPLGATHGRSPLKRVVVLVIGMLAFNSCQDITQPMAPTVESLSMAEANGDGSGVLLATTNEGELVRIDIDLGTAVYVGNVGELPDGTCQRQWDTLRD